MQFLMWQLLQGEGLLHMARAFGGQQGLVEH